MDADVITSFHQAAKLRRPDVFSDNRLMPISATEDAETAAPGWVGPQWKQGTLLIGINPGGGGDTYRRNPTDDELYTLLRRFRDTVDENARDDALAAVSAAWIRIQRTHNIWRVIRAILDATGEPVEEIAFLNLLPFRTRMDQPAPAASLRQAWAKATSAQVAALRPRRIIALGKKSWDALIKLPAMTQSELILFKRGIGDSYIPNDSQAVLDQLRAERALSDAS